MSKSVGRLLGRDKKIFHIAVLIIILFAAIMGSICLKYYKSLQQTVFEESSSYLNQMSKQMCTSTTKIIDDNYAVLGTVSSVLKSFGDPTLAEFKKIVEEQKDYWHYTNILLVNADGVMYDSDGKTVTMPSQDYLSKTIAGREFSMSYSQVIDGEESVVFALPVEGIHIMGEDISALCATYRLDAFDKILSTDVFEGKAFTHIIDSEGTMVIRSSSPYAEQSGYNLLTYLRSEAQESAESIDKMNMNIKLGTPGIVSSTIAGEPYYVSYHPLESRNWCLVTFVPTAVANEKSNIYLRFSAMFFLFIAVTMITLVIMLILNFVRHNKQLENIAFIDRVTGGNTIHYFQFVAEKILKENPQEKFAMVYLNMSNFKITNDQFGRETGDLILRLTDQSIRSGLSEKECSGRVMADHFCVLAQYESEEAMVKRFEDWYEAVSKGIAECGLDIVTPAACFGVYIINIPTMSIPLMTDRAKLSLNEGTWIHHNKIRYSLYDENTREKLFREKQLEDHMEDALKSGEFEVYLQPKYTASTREIDGAEALIRWHGKDGKMIYPDEFIPLFERNGFIIQIDLWVFEQVCMLLQKWVDNGQKPVTISINCSRTHLTRTDFIDSYREIFSRYHIPAKFIEIELTESIFYEDTKLLVSLINELHEIGFTCSIDDFGSGYSSLNIIQDIPVDALKLDRIFFRNTTANKERAKSVIGSIIQMAKALSMHTVAEGVEEEEQVKMLAELSCDLIQGYVFAKPMPIAQFEERQAESSRGPA